MCTDRNISYVHKCTKGGFKVVMATTRHRCPWCKATAGQLLAVGKVVPERAPSEGHGGLTGRPFAAPRPG